MKILNNMKDSLSMFLYISIPLPNSEKVSGFAEFVQKQSLEYGISYKKIISQYKQLNNEIYEKKDNYFFEEVEKFINSKRHRE